MTEEICCSKSEGYRQVNQLELHESTLGLLKGAERQYRDSRPTNSVHAREYTAQFCFHRDKYNPDYYLIEHFVVDYIKPEAWVVGGLTFAGKLASNNEDWKSALKWGLVGLIITQLLVDNN